VSIFLFTTTSYADQPKWQDICPNNDVPYCKNVGKNALNNSTNPPLLKGIKLGKLLVFVGNPKGV
jgi:hypothetical protein